MGTPKTQEIEEQLRFLGLRYLVENWETTWAEAKKQNPSYYQFTKDILLHEVENKRERQKAARIKRANIDEPLIMDTFPFNLQPNLKKKFVMELYDSLRYMTHPQDMILMGPTGCGKSGLATAYLLHAINNGYKGYFIDFKDLLGLLHQSVANHSEKKIIKRFLGYDIITIDELGYTPIGKEQAGLFFDLMKKRHKKKTTIITTQLGYDEWASFLQNKHMTAALIDRMTENCTLFNMKKCISIRPKKVTYATKD
jgi:DNA replication protein DnaC